MKTFLLFFGFAILFWIAMLGFQSLNDRGVEETCWQQLYECQQHVRQLDSTITAQTEYYREFYGVHKAAMPGDTVVLIFQ